MIEEDDWEVSTVTIDWEAPTKVEPLASTVDLIERFDEKVVGHSRAKEALAGALRMQTLRAEGASPRVLLMGPRGVGKTTLAQAMCEATELPSVRIDFGEIDPTDLPRLLANLVPYDPVILPYGVLFLDSLEHLARDEGRLQVDLLRVARDPILICGAVAIEGPLKHTASQAELRSVLHEEVRLLPEFTSVFDILIPIDRLNAAQVAKTFALNHSAFARARRVIHSLGGTFQCDQTAVEALARTCALSPVGSWAASRVIDRLLEQVLRSADPAQSWRLSPQS